MKANTTKDDTNLPVSWQEKQVVQDIERANVCPSEVTLDWLTTNYGSGIYGSKGNSEDKKRRTEFSTAIQVSSMKAQLYHFVDSFVSRLSLAFHRN